MRRPSLVARAARSAARTVAGAMEEAPGPMGCGNVLVVAGSAAEEVAALVILAAEAGDYTPRFSTTSATGPSHPGLFNAQYMTRMARIASMPPKAMRCRPSETLWMPLKRKMLAANERKRAKMPGLQRMRLASSAKLPSRT
jgi:hypothetical protein